MSLKELAGAVEAKEKWTPPEPEKGKMVKLDWKGKSWSAPLRLMTPSERLTRDRLCAGFLGVRTGAAETFPNYRYWFALATIRALWNDIPDWMDWLVTNHSTIAIELLSQVEDYEDSFREGLGIEGGQEAGGPVISVST